MRFGRIDGETMTVILRHGGLNVLKATKTDAALAALVYEMFQRRVSLVLDGEERVNEQDEGYRNMMESAEREAAMREKARSEQIEAMPSASVSASSSELPKPKKPSDSHCAAYGWAA